MNIRHHFLPALLGKPAINDLERVLISLPVHLGGLGIVIPSHLSTVQFNTSLQVTKPLVDLIVEQSRSYPFDTILNQQSIKSQVKYENQCDRSQEAENLHQQLPDNLKRAMDLAQEKGASSWLSVLPLEELGFSLHKGAFRDAVSLRYGWQLSYLPNECICGKQFSVEHAFSCSHGGFPSLRHNEIRDITAGLLTEVCSNVEIEPSLQPLSGERFTYGSANVQDDARLDIKARGFWGERHQCAFFDVRVFNPHAPTNRHMPRESCYKKHEKEKRRCYEQRVREVEKGSFTPVVLSMPLVAWEGQLK